MSRKYYALTAGDKTDWTIVDLALEHISQVMLLGPPSSGKTYAAQRMALKGRKMTTITLTVETPADTLKGFYMPKGGEFMWQDGVAISAMRLGGRLVINEISAASADVMSFLYPILEDPETCIITLPTGETVKSKKGFQVVATDNAPFEHLPEPIQSRLVPFYVATPKEEAYAPFPVAIRPLVQKTVECDKAEGRLSLRHWHKVLALMEHANLSLPDALKVLLKAPNNGIVMAANAMEVTK